MGKLKRHIALILALFLLSCENDTDLSSRYLTKHVIVVVIDGPRYSETWGDPQHQYIPKLANELSKRGTIFTQFYNNGPTYTNQSHAAITTGQYQQISNNGSELPLNPSIFQYWIEAHDQQISDAWIVASKGKLEILANCQKSNWNDKYIPSTNCGINGLGSGSGYRHDSITFIRAKDILTTYRPSLLLINFREPDYSGHKNDWKAYLEGIKKTDQYVYELFSFIDSDPFYSGTTTLFVTNDHGRHLDEISNGFISHGDGCAGCRHINLYAFGPDIKENHIEQKNRELIDIPSTISELMSFDATYSQGEVMYEILK